MERVPESNLLVTTTRRNGTIEQRFVQGERADVIAAVTSSLDYALLDYSGGTVSLKIDIVHPANVARV